MKQPCKPTWVERVLRASVYFVVACFLISFASAVQSALVRIDPAMRFYVWFVAALAAPIVLMSSIVVAAVPGFFAEVLARLRRIEQLSSGEPAPKVEPRNENLNVADESWAASLNEAKPAVATASRWLVKVRKGDTNKMRAVEAASRDEAEAKVRRAGYELLSITESR